MILKNVKLEEVFINIKGYNYIIIILDFFKSLTFY